jgi:hypothetical protein
VANSTRKKKDPGELTPRQRKLVEGVTDPSCVSIAEAARRAGYKDGPAINAVANETLKIPKVAAAVEKRKAELAAHAEVTDVQVLGGTAKIAFASIEDALDKDGRFDFKKAVKTGAADLIKKISHRPSKYGEAVTVEFYPKDAALAKLGDYLGLNKDNAPNPKAAALKLLETVANEKRISKREAIEWLLKEQQERRQVLIPQPLLLDVARENGVIVEVEGLQ